MTRIAKDSRVKNIRTMDDLDLAQKRAVIRVDLNVPVKAGEVTDLTRIERVARTIREAAGKAVAVVLLAHFDRPNGKVVPDMSLRPVVPALARALGRPVDFIATDWRDDPVGKARSAKNAVMLMENTRFHPGEEANDPQFARVLAGLGDVYINDAFSAAHRAHASTEFIARLLPAAAGRAMEAELAALAQALEEPARPLLAIVGGAKISTKLDLLANLIVMVDTLVIGGGMANTFLAAKGFDVGRSLCEHDLLGTARDIMRAAEAKNHAILLPSDAVLAPELKNGADVRIASVDAVKPEEKIFDIGPATVAAVNAALDRAKTLVWNGPFGAFEVEPFDRGTLAVARHVAGRTRDGRLVSIAGGGDTVAALNRAGVADDFTYVSTAGGAFLEWLEGKTLPGVKVLEWDRQSQTTGHRT